MERLTADLGQGGGFECVFVHNLCLLRQKELMMSGRVRLLRS